MDGIKRSGTVCHLECKLLIQEHGTFGVHEVSLKKLQVCAATLGKSNVYICAFDKNPWPVADSAFGAGWSADMNLL